MYSAYFLYFTLQIILFIIYLRYDIIYDLWVRQKIYNKQIN